MAYMPIHKRLPIIRDNFDSCQGSFNFHKVKLAMQALDWSWATTAGKVPTIAQMEEAVYQLFERACREIEKGKAKEVRWSSGGFEVSVGEDNHVRIAFIVEEQGSEMNE